MTQQAMVSPAKQQTRRDHSERIYREWNKALANNDAKALLALYAPDAVLESPLCSVLLGPGNDIVQGHDGLRRLFEEVVKRKPKLRQFYHRSGYFSDGRTMMFEYPRATPDGEQMDFVEVMELDGALIKKHCVYWGWRGLQVLARDEYHH
jgi:hypothetical protein